MNTNKNTNINIVDEAEPPPDPGGSIKTSELSKIETLVGYSIRRNNGNTGNGDKNNHKKEIIKMCGKCGEETIQNNGGTFFDIKKENGKTENNYVIKRLEIYFCKGCRKMYFEQNGNGKNGKYQIQRLAEN